MKEIEIGLAIFIDGAIQPIGHLNYLQSSEGLRPIDELQYAESHESKPIDNRVTVVFACTIKKVETLS